MSRISESAHDPSAKLWIYNHAIIARLRYVLTVNPGLSFTHMLRLQKLATRHIRKWLNIAKASTSELLYSERGWALMSLSKLWLHCTAQNLNQMNASRDPAVRHALRIKIENEKRQRSRGHVRPAADLCNIRSTHLTRFVSCPHTGPATYQGRNSPLGHINPHRHQIPAMQDRGTNPKAHSRGMPSCSRSRALHFQTRLHLTGPSLPCKRVPP